MSLTPWPSVSAKIQLIDRSTTDDDAGAIENVTDLYTGVVFTINRPPTGRDGTANTPQSFRQTLRYKVRSYDANAANLNVKHQLVWTDPGSGVTHTARIVEPMAWKNFISPGFWSGVAEEAAQI